MATMQPLTEIEVRTDTRDETKTHLLPPYNVIILNDDFHSADFVVKVLHQVMHYQLEKCVQLMRQANDTGRAIVWTGQKEVAELKMEQLQTFREVPEGPPIGVELEPAV